jgi:hypothetical protein
MTAHAQTHRFNIGELTFAVPQVFHVRTRPPERLRWPRRLFGFADRIRWLHVSSKLGSGYSMIFR